MPIIAVPLHLLVLLPVLIGAIAWFLPGRLYRIVMLLGSLTVLFLALELFCAVRWGADRTQFAAGWPEIVAIKLTADRFSAPMVLMTALFFTAVYLFSFHADHMDKNFVFIFQMLEGALFGLFLSGDLFNIYILMELGMLSVAILIMYKQEKQSVYDAMLYIMMNFIAMAFMMFGIAYLYRITGVMDLQVMQQRIAALADPKAAAIPYAMIMTAVALKAALLPLFGWLPRAHGAPSAPAVVSAVLSGIQVKVGVYLLIRLGILFSPVIDARPFFMILGFATSVIGFLLAVAQKDIKLILAYHTVSQVGLIVMGLNLGSEIAFWGGMYHIINHALFKGLLFLTAGIIIERYGTRTYSEIRGVLRSMPLIGIAALAGMLGITGAPFFNGSISKYFISRGGSGTAAEIGLFLINFGTILSFVKYGTILFGKPNCPSGPKTDPLAAGIALLFGTAVFAGGIFGTGAVYLAFGQRFSAAGALDPVKVLTFLGTLGLGAAGYRFVILPLGGFLSSIRSFKFSFNIVTVFITLFFSLLLGYFHLSS